MSLLDFWRPEAKMIGFSSACAAAGLVKVNSAALTVVYPPSSERIFTYHLPSNSRKFGVDTILPLVPAGHPDPGLAHTRFSMSSVPNGRSPFAGFSAGLVSSFCPSDGLYPPNSNRLLIASFSFCGRASNSASSRAISASSISFCFCFAYS